MHKMAGPGFEPGAPQPRRAPVSDMETSLNRNLRQTSEDVTNKATIGSLEDGLGTEKGNQRLW